MASPTLRFRSLTQSDRGRLEAMLREAYAPLLLERAWAGEGDRFSHFDAHVFAQRNRLHAPLVFLGLMGQDEIGFIACQPDEQRRTATLDQVCVLPTFRNRGFSKQLLGEAMRRLKPMGVSTIRAHIPEHPFFTPAHRLMASCGFVETERVRGTTDPKERLIEFTRHADQPGGKPGHAQPAPSQVAVAPAAAAAAQHEHVVTPSPEARAGGPIELASDPDAPAQGASRLWVDQPLEALPTDTPGSTSKGYAMNDPWEDGRAKRSPPSLIRGLGAAVLITIGIAMTIWTAITAYQVMGGDQPPTMVRTLTPSATEGQALITVPQGPINFSPVFFTFAGYVLTCGLIAVMAMLSVAVIKYGVLLVRRG